MSWIVNLFSNLHERTLFHSRSRVCVFVLLQVFIASICALFKAPAGILNAADQEASFASEKHYNYDLIKCMSLSKFHHPAQSLLQV